MSDPDKLIQLLIFTSTVYQFSVNCDIHYLDAFHTLFNSDSHLPLGLSHVDSHLRLLAGYKKSSPQLTVAVVEF